MKPVFLDTSGLIATINTRDQWHNPATDAWKQLIDSDTPLVTTSLVLIEIGDGLSRIQHRELAIALRDRLLGSPRVDVLQIQRRREVRGWELYRSRADKNWGVTDCISMAVIEERGITQVFTADHHFSQAGYEILLLSDGSG